MAKRRVIVGSVGFGVLLVALALRATMLHSLGAVPLIYRATVKVNDLDSVEGLAPPGRYVELWAKQRNFREGDPEVDPFGWCAWKNGGNPIQLGATRADNAGVWRFSELRRAGNTVMVFPPGPGGDVCLGGIYTELLPRACDAPGINCTAWDTPKLHWLNVRKITTLTGAVAGSVSDAERASASVADGPNDGPEPSDVVDVDENGIDTTAPGYSYGQRVTWKCGAGGNAVCPSVTIHDSTTAVSVDPEYPFVLGTIQAHRPGGSFIAAAAVKRGQPIGFSVNVNVRFRGFLDINLGCDRDKLFDFSPF
jgi:hypothetical protein